MKRVTVLGIDPGSVRCGYGVILAEGPKTTYVASGTLSPSPSKPLPERL